LNSLPMAAVTWPSRARSMDEPAHAAPPAQRPPRRRAHAQQPAAREYLRQIARDSQ
jgi:hypothetical protein